LLWLTRSSLYYGPRGDGGADIDYIVEDLRQASGQTEDSGAADYDVTIIGIGPARLSSTAKEKARIKNDYVFALIGGAKPTTFLESIGIKVD
jgi:hypothetical protein